MCLSSKQIAGFFYLQFLWKESNISVFLPGDSYHGKVASRTATFGWVWSGVPLILIKSQNSVIINISGNLSLSFFCIEIVIKGR